MVFGKREKEEEEKGGETQVSEYEKEKEEWERNRMEELGEERGKVRKRRKG